eukprot:maker-scaffold879_size85478-snap-gene-0.21 protein:Tk11987 transcript:maker-scaffold879_size85478-snap-gene-0.21-mRNA-1 annotation:"plasma kallikrein isoform x2"
MYFVAQQEDGVGLRVTQLVTSDGVGTGRSRQGSVVGKVLLKAGRGDQILERGQSRSLDFDPVPGLPEGSQHLFVEFELGILHLWVNVEENSQHHDSILQLNGLLEARKEPIHEHKLELQRRPRIMITMLILRVQPVQDIVPSKWGRNELNGTLHGKEKVITLLGMEEPPCRRTWKTDNQAQDRLSMKTIGVLATLATLAVSVWAQTEECPFGPGSCPVTLENVVDVYFHDIADMYSCQRECATIPECNFFTMFGEQDDPIDHRKCFLFKTCDYLEDCDVPGCMNGPAEPPLDECLDDSYTCQTELDNIVDVYYFDQADNFSCHHQCTLLDDCFFYTQFDINDHPSVKHKCFLYKNCDFHEPCIDCDTGPK